MSELSKKVSDAISRIQAYNPRWFSEDRSFYLAFSGGKDSCVVKRLMDMAGVPYDAHYRVTSVDPPELVQFIRQHHKDVKFDVPRYSACKGGPALVGKPVTMWNLIPLEKYGE